VTYPSTLLQMKAPGSSPGDFSISSALLRHLDPDVAFCWRSSFLLHYTWSRSTLEGRHFSWEGKNMKILLATDGSALCNAVVKEFASRALNPGTKVHIISVYDSSPYMSSSDPLMGPLIPLNKAIIDYAQRFAIRAVQSAETIIRKKKPRLSVSIAAIQGSPKQVILATARKFRADLIIIGSHGHGRISGFLLGSVSQAVALHATCSVEIVRIRKEKK
jgi:nucleotide-binding universal stress UspA family protein